MNKTLDSRLKSAMADYLLWMIEHGYADHTWAFYDRIFQYFAEFISRQDIAWQAIFTQKTLMTFSQECKLTKFAAPIRSLSRFLLDRHEITAPLGKKKQDLPEIYENYLVYYQKNNKVTVQTINRTRRVLGKFVDWLFLQKIKLAGLKIEQLDQFMAELNAPYAPVTRMHNRSFMRGFMHYSYNVCNIGYRDLAVFIIGATQFGNGNPPRFLRPNELQKLFNLQPQTPIEKRTVTMVKLAYFAGLRPKEISQIRLDDIQFRQLEINLPQRKGFNPISMPLPDEAIKAIARYIIEVRPKTDKRSLFITTRPPYKTVSPGMVSLDIKNFMLKAGVSASAYWLRHTYAQNLLEANVSVFEIKEMLGHDQIQTTKRYLHIHTKMMREVLFNESL